MDKFYDIYARENGRWKRKGVNQGGIDTPEYDGTVVIEKDSVLRLRKFKPYANLTSDYTFKSSDLIQDIVDWSINNSFEITPLEISIDGGEMTISGFSIPFNFVDNTKGETYISCCAYVGTETDGIVMAPIFASLGDTNLFKELVENYINEFNVISTTNTDVDNWLLTNTEGVSV